MWFLSSTLVTLYYDVTQETDDLPTLAFSIDVQTDDSSSPADERWILLIPFFFFFFLLLLSREMYFLYNNRFLKNCDCVSTF